MVVRVTRTLVCCTAYAMTRSIVRSGQWALIFRFFARGAGNARSSSAWPLEPSGDKWKSETKGDGAAAAVPLVRDGQVEGSDWTELLHSSICSDQSSWMASLPPCPESVATPLNYGTRHRATTCNRIETRPPADTSSLKI